MERHLRNPFSSKTRFIVLAVVILVSIGIAQIIFTILRKTQIESTSKLVHSVLRQEVNISNNFLMSRTLLDLEYLQLISCTKVVSKKTGQLLLDLSYNHDCGDRFTFMPKPRADLSLESLTGEVWEISFEIKDSTFFQISLWLSRFFIILLSLTTLFFIYQRIDHISILATKNATLAHHAAQVAHDIKSPLSVISLLSSRIGSDSPEEAKLLQEAAKGIIKSAENLLANVRNRQQSQDGPKVSEQSPSSSTPYTPALIPAQSILNLDSLCRRTLEMKRVEYKDSKVTVRLSMYSNLPDTNRQVIYDPHHLESIISNVLNNGIEAIDRDGFINMDCSLDEDFVSLEIRDSGKGIPKDILERLGKEGVSHGKTNGNGIGLLHAFQTIQSWNGQMEIQSDGQRGSTVKIRLPSFKGPDAP